MTEFLAQVERLQDRLSAGPPAVRPDKLQVARPPRASRPSVPSSSLAPIDGLAAIRLIGKIISSRAN